MKEDLYLTKVLLAASKKAVTRNWLNVNTPKQKQWLEIVREILARKTDIPAETQRESIWNIYMRHETNWTNAKWNTGKVERMVEFFQTVC